MSQKGIDWAEAISFMQKQQEQYPDDYNCKLTWKRLQLGDRTQDLLMHIYAMKSLTEDTLNSSPEWQKAIKWLTYTRAQQSNLMLDMIWSQLETGDRTPELLTLIRQAANAPPPPAPAPVQEPPPPVIDNTPPANDF